MKLTPREHDVYRLISKGFTNDEIASTLYISKHTVKIHVTSILEKLGAKNRVHAAYLAGVQDRKNPNEG